jgi:hypothetical protein
MVVSIYLLQIQKIHYTTSLILLFDIFITMLLIL